MAESSLPLFALANATPSNSSDARIDASPVLQKLDRLEHMLERITGPAERPDGKPVKPPTKWAVRREQGLTHLYRNPKSGIFYWRRVDELKGRRVVRSTKTRDEAIAILLGAKFEEEYQRRRAGLAVYDSYAKPVAPAVEHWLKALNVSEPVRKLRSVQIQRAITLLKITTFADFDDISRLDRDLLRLEGARTGDARGPINRLTLVRTFQGPLKQFTKWCARNRRYMPEDPLAQWDLLCIPTTLERRRRRAVSPAEMARATFAAEALDRIYEREHPNAIFFTSLLVTGARFGALHALNVPNLLRDRSKLDLGPGVGKKRKGDASLDARSSSSRRTLATGRPARFSSARRVSDSSTTRLSGVGARHSGSHSSTSSGRTIPRGHSS